MKEGNYNVKAKTYDQTLKVNLKMPKDAIPGQKYDILLNFYDVPEDNGGISMTTAMDVKICLQVGEYVPALSPEVKTNTTTYIIIGIIALAVLILIVWLIFRKKK